MWGIFWVFTGGRYYGDDQTRYAVPKVADYLRVHIDKFPTDMKK